MRAPPNGGTRDGSGFNIMLQAFPLDGKIVCRAIAEGEDAQEPPAQQTGRNIRHLPPRR